MTAPSSTMLDVQGLRALGWSWTRIAAHYRVSEGEVRRWDRGDSPAPERAPRPAALEWGTALVINDAQYPYTDMPLWEATCQIAADLDIDTVIWAGDMLDFPQLSTFRHNPYALGQAKQDVENFHIDLRGPLRRAVGPVREVWCDGNHEYRYTRYCEYNAGALGGLSTPADFLELPTDMVWYPWGRGIGEWITPGLLVAHGWNARKFAAYTAKANADEMGSRSVLVGHTHRVGVHMRTTPSGVQRSYEAGHMAEATWLPKAVEGYNDWQQCAGTLVYYRRDGSAYHVELLPVTDSDEVLVGGRVYTVDR